MDETQRCPDCGRENPAAATSCEHCGFPLGEAAPAPPPPAAARPASAAPVSRSSLRPIRPRRPGPPSAIALQLWLVFGTFCALVVIFVAFKANIDRANAPVEGSSAAQQRDADLARDRLARDSTDQEARVRLADILYDTGNWADAIVQYRAAVRRDSTLVNALVDLGVSYYNLGESKEAERHFRLALDRDPHQPVALFNLGIVHEARGEPKQALEYFHRALQSDPPEKMKQPLLEAMTRAQQKAGAKPPPLPDGR